jgi:6-phosphogluconate dehydrogenase
MFKYINAIIKDVKIYLYNEALMCWHDGCIIRSELIQKRAMMASFIP